MFKIKRRIFHFRFKKIDIYMKIVTNWICLICMFLTCNLCFSQNYILGEFNGLANQSIRLMGYKGFDTYRIDSVWADEKGSFKLNFSTEDYGVGFLQSEGDKQIQLILNEEQIQLKGIDFALTDALKIVKSKENQLLEQYMSEYFQRERTMAGWDYLKRIYLSEEPSFSKVTEAKEAILKERARIRQEDLDFLNKLPKELYAHWYLPIRKLINSVSIIAQNRPEEIPEATEAFRQINYADDRLYKSGMLQDILESQIWLIENSGYEMDEMYQQMSVSIDAVLKSLVDSERKYNKIADRLFKILEKRSLFGASEYLALKILIEESCTLDDKLVNQLESYRAIKIGNIAPDIDFAGGVTAANFKEVPQKLSDLNSDYTVVVFGASWCPACQKEFIHLIPLYSKWKEQGVEVVFISLDTEKEMFENFTSVLPFLSICDYQKWNAEAVKDYHVFATPTLFLLDKNREILLRPNSIEQMDAWVDWYLIQGHEIKKRGK